MTEDKYQKAQKSVPQKENLNLKNIETVQKELKYNKYKIQ